MYRSLSVLSVSSDMELKDPARIRRLFLHYYRGMIVAAALFGLAGTCLLGSAAWALIAGPAGWTCLVLFLIGAALWGMAGVFLFEFSISPLRGYARTPDGYEFENGRLTDSAYLSDGKASTARVLAEGEFSKGKFRAEFDPRAWSEAFRENDEARNLRKGDDRFDQKGLRRALPVDAWVLYRKDAPWQAALAGLHPSKIGKSQGPIQSRP